MFAFVSDGRNLMSSQGRCAGHSVGSVGVVDVHWSFLLVGNNLITQGDGIKLHSSRVPGFDLFRKVGLCYLWIEVFDR